MIEIDKVKEIAKTIPVDKYIAIEIEPGVRSGKSDNHWVTAVYGNTMFYFSIFNESQLELFSKNKKLICYFEMNPKGFLACKDIIIYNHLREKFLVNSQIKRSPTSNAQISLDIQRQTRMLNSLAKDVYEIKQILKKSEETL